MTTEKVRICRHLTRMYARRKGICSDTAIAKGLKTANHRKTLESRWNNGWAMEHAEELAVLLSVTVGQLHPIENPDGQ